MQIDKLIEIFEDVIVAWQEAEEGLINAFSDDPYSELGELYSTIENIKEEFYNYLGNNTK